MKAVIANGPKDYTLVYDKPIPKIQDGQVLVKVLANGICNVSFFCQIMFHLNSFRWF
jgi:D-arabinose 1-dehydrogenase-like Zn-dependent alcohol dehydrogenase